MGGVANVTFEALLALAFTVFGLGLKVTRREPPAWLSPLLFTIAAFLWFLAAGKAFDVPTWKTVGIGLAIATVVALGFATSPAADQVPAAADGQYLPLIEAATRAYEQTRGTLVATFAEAEITRREERHESIITYFCYLLGERLSIYGNCPPSRTREEIDWMAIRKQYNFKFRNGALIFERQHSKDHYEKLEVLASELPRALEEIKALSPPVLEFVWPEDRGLNLHVEKTKTNIFLIVRNPSTTITATGVHVVLEWMMRTKYRNAGGTPQRDEVRLPLEYGSGDEADIEPLGKQRFRLCSMVNSEDDEHTLVVPSSHSPAGYNAGTGTFQFQVRAKSRNVASSLDLYEIELSSDGGFTTTRMTKATIDV
jgi:hypothetical protein